MNISKSKSVIRVAKLSMVLLPLFVFQVAFPGCTPKQIQQLGKTLDGGVFKSTNGAFDWEQKVRIDEKTTISDVTVNNVFFSPNDSKAMYLTTNENGLLKTTDGGETWQKITDEAKIFAPNATVIDLAIDPQNIRNMYLAVSQGIRGQVLKSEDEGKSWKEIYVTPQDKQNVTNIEIDYNNPKTIYITTSGGGFLKSNDYGTSWNIVKWFGFALDKFVIIPKDPRIMYLYSGGWGLARSNNGGLDWVNISEKISKTANIGKVEVIAFDSNNPNIIYLGSNFGLVRSTDSGESWEIVATITPPGSATILAIALDPESPQIIYYAVGSLIYKSIDNGINWTIHRLPTSRTIKTLVIDPKEPDTIYAGLLGAPKGKPKGIFGGF